MNHFDDGFNATKRWLDTSEGAQPCPPIETTNEERVAWWSGADKAREFYEAAKQQDDADDKQIEDAVIGLCYALSMTAGVWLMYQGSWCIPIGGFVALYSAYKLRYPTK